MKKFTFTALILAGTFAISSCTKNETPKTDPVSKTMTVNATSYTDWVYVNFETGETKKAAVEDTATPEGFDWDIAIHRYDIKTNGGEAVATEMKSLDAVNQAPQSGYVKDSQGKIIVDISDMMNGNIGYADTNLNSVLCTWIKQDMSSMPPVTTLSELVYVIKGADGKYTKIRFTDNRNDENKTGHITFEYVHPIE